MKLIKGKVKSEVTGSSVAHDAPSTANPILGGFVAEATTPAAVADGDLSQAAGTLYGAAFVNPVTSAGAQTTGATGAAAPAGAMYLGVNAGGNLVGATAPGVGTDFASNNILAVGNGVLSTSDGGWKPIFRASQHGDGDDGKNMQAVQIMTSNGATLDRLKSVNTGQLVVTPKGSAGSEVIAATGAAVPAGGVLVGGVDGAGSTLQTAMVAQPTGDNEGGRRGWFVNGRGQRYNGSGWDLERNNTVATPLASGSFTSTRTGPDQVNYNGRGVMYIVEVTTNPAGAETLQLVVDCRDSITTRPLVTFTASAFGGGAGYLIAIIYPDAVETIADANMEIQGIPLSKTFRARLVPSAAGTWVASLTSINLL